MNKDFFNNPLKIIYYGRKELLPLYLWVLWLLLSIIIFGGSYVGVIQLSLFTVDRFFSPSITGLSFTLALFIAEKNVFDIKELKVLRKTKREKDKFEGLPLIELFAPFLFTAMLFLLISIVCIVAPYIVLKVPPYIYKLAVGLFLSSFILGVICLFNLLNMFFNESYHKAGR